MSDLRMDAYYYRFQPTGVYEIDLILCAVASAGKAFHHTEAWTDNMSYTFPDCVGASAEDWIQNAANSAAKAWKEKRDDSA